MADGYWNQQPPLHHPEGLAKRPRTDYGFPFAGIPSGHDMPNYLSHSDDRTGSQAIKDTQSIGSAYDRYLQSKQLSSFGSGEASGNFGGGGIAGRASAGMPGLHPIREPPFMGGPRSHSLDMVPNGRGSMGFGSQIQADPIGRPGREVISLPPDATNTLYVEGLPPDSTKREVAHIFRPFLGYEEVRLVTKESKRRGGDPLILCFVDFVNPACAATALSALQGYKMDEHEPDSHILRLQFSKHPGPRSGSGPRGKR